MIVFLISVFAVTKSVVTKNAKDCFLENKAGGIKITPVVFQVLPSFLNTLSSF